MTIVGLDLSLTRTGVCRTVQIGNWGVASIETRPPKCLQERINQIVTEVMRVVDADCRVFIEGHSFGSFGGQMRDRAELAGVVKQQLWLSNIPFSLVPPTVLKKYVTGKGNAEKPLMLHMIIKKTGVECENDDQADALALADFGWHVLNPESPRRELLQYEKETIAAFVAPKVKKPRKRKAE
jgi:crossover junction endodeoxyribonuclease RuvC